MKRIVCIWLPNWPIQRLVAARPELSKRAIVLYEPANGGHPCVIACSSNAQGLGVRRGMPVTEATALAARGGRPAPWYCQPTEPAADLAALRKLARKCHQFSPLVGLEEAERPDCLLLAITGLEPVVGSEENMVRKLRAVCRDQGFSIRGAIAGTVGAAWALAHFMRSWTESGRSLAEGDVVAPGPPPDFVLVPPAAESLQVLKDLPVEALRLTSKTVTKLEQLGIERIGQLVSLPRSELAVRFGKHLGMRVDQVTGRVDEPIVAHRPRPDLAAEWLLEFPTDRYQVIDRILEKLIGRVTQQLAVHGWGALQLVCHFFWQSGHAPTGPDRHLNQRPESRAHGTVRAPPNAFTLTTGLFQPTASASHLLALVRLQMAQMRLAGLVDKVSVRVTAKAPLIGHQRRLFADGRSRSESSQLAALVDRLTGRLGRQAVVCVQMVPDAQPERAVRETPLVADRTDGRQSTMAAGPLPALERPLQVFSPPKPIGAVGKNTAKPKRPDENSGLFPVDAKERLALDLSVPAQLLLGGRTYSVIHHWGPERIETGWWREEPVRRDYYRMETATGERFWLFRRLQDGKWFLHGMFG